MTSTPALEITMAKIEQHLHSIALNLEALRELQADESERNGHGIGRSALRAQLAAARMRDGQ